MTKVVGALQARMGSSRLPGKVMLPLAGKPLVAHIIDRMRRAACCAEIVLATTTDVRNDALVDFCRSEGLLVVRAVGEDDLAERLAAVVDLTRADYVLKTAGDCPLVDPDVMAQITATALREKSDFCSNRVRWSYPLGLSCDVLSASAIMWCHKNLSSAEDRELFATWIRDHADRFRVTSFESPVDLSHHSWLVDTPEDYAWMSSVFDTLYRPGECFSTADVLNHLRLKSAS